jgi:hypothetical protein
MKAMSQKGRCSFLPVQQDEPCAETSLSMPCPTGQALLKVIVGSARYGSPIKADVSFGTILNELEVPPQQVETRALPRSASRLGRAMFTTLLEMTMNQPWLKERQPSLIDLIDECEEYRQQQLVFELLERFTFLDAPNFQQAIQGIADYIQVQLGLSPDNAAISASDNSKYADSSQFVVYSLKAAAKWNAPNWSTTCLFPT